MRHRVVVEVAVQYLITKAKKLIDELLDVSSLANVLNYVDDIKSDPKYNYLSPLNYVNLSSDKTYDIAPKSTKGDLVMAVKKM